MSISHAEVATKVKTTMITVLRHAVTPDEIGEDMLLSAPEIGVDSLNLLEVIVRLEKELGIEFSDHEVFQANLCDVSDLIGLIEHKIRS